MCSNSVIYTWVDETKRKEFEEYLVRAQDSDKGTLPFITTEEDPKNGYKVPDSYFFDLGNCGEEHFVFESKWNCPITTMVKCAKEFKFDFELDYEEPTCGIYGKYQYNWGGNELWHKEVDQDKYYKISNKEQDDKYEELDDLLDDQTYELKDDGLQED